MPTNNMSNLTPLPFVPNYDPNPVVASNPLSPPPPYTSNQGLPTPPAVERGQPAFNSIAANAPSGWNDPPVFNKPPKAQVSLNIENYSYY